MFVGYLIILPGCVAMIILIRLCLLSATIEGSSMESTFKDGDRVLVWRLFPTLWLRKNAIVLLQQVYEKGISGPLSIKRVSALAGEIRLPVARQDLRDISSVNVPGNISAMQTWNIPSGHVFVCGDNAEQSIDSRVWGPLPRSCIRGIVLKKLPSRRSPRSLSMVRQNQVCSGLGLPAGQTAPDFSAQTLNGETIRLSNYRGQALLLFFIDTNTLSRAHLPVYQAIAARAAGSRLNVLFLCHDRYPGAQALATDMHVTQPILVVPQEHKPVLKKYGLAQMPSYCLIDYEGKVRTSGIGSRQLVIECEHFWRLLNIQNPDIRSEKGSVL